jgi:hypothetical protein
MKIIILNKTNLMRPTDLHFRSPVEHSPEYHDIQQDKNGLNYNIKHTQKNFRGSNFSRTKRFKDDRFYCQGTGASVYNGPGSYNPMTAHNKLVDKPCLSKFVSNFVYFNQPF